MKKRRVLLPPFPLHCWHTLHVTDKRWWWRLWSVICTMGKLRDPGNPTSCPDNHLPSWSKEKRVKARKRQITLLFAEILPQDGTLCLTKAEYVVQDGEQGALPWHKTGSGFYLIFWGESELSLSKERSRKKAKGMCTYAGQLCSSLGSRKGTYRGWRSRYLFSGSGEKVAAKEVPWWNLWILRSEFTSRGTFLFN